MFSKLLHKIPFRASSSFTLLGKLRAENASEKVMSIVQRDEVVATTKAAKDEISVIQRELNLTAKELASVKDEFNDLKSKGVSFQEIHNIAYLRSFQGI
jgi:hypothetical protein